MTRQPGVAPISTEQTRFLLPKMLDAGELFEYWAHEASLLPIETLPWFRWTMDAKFIRWPGLRRMAEEHPDVVDRSPTAFTVEAVEPFHVKGKAKPVAAWNLGPVSAGKPASALSPEKSTQFSFGLVFEPMRGLSFTADYFQLKIKDLISGLPEQEVFASSTKYASRFVRCSTVAAGGVPGITLGAIDACAALSATQDPIAFIDTPTENLGELKVNGIDLSANWRIGATPAGNFGLNMEGTYITKYNYQRERGGAFIDALGRYSDNAPVFRWQHVIAVDWAMGPFSATLGQRYKSGYTDQDGTSKVDSYTIYDASFTYVPMKNLTLTLIVNNLLDQDPPRSVQVTTFQRGYDPRFTDPLGRAFTLRAGFKF